MELPYHLKTLEPLASALDIIRFLGELDAPADVDEICEGLDISERRFSKAIRRLVTKGYVAMDGDMIYRLTDQGHEAVEILAEYDEAHPEEGRGNSGDGEGSSISRRLVVAIPGRLVAEQVMPVVVGLDGADEESQVLQNNADMVVRLSVVNGEPSRPQEETVELGNQPVKKVFSVIPGAYDQVRIRVQVFQLGPNPDDINVAGGLYVDADVTRSGKPDDLIAYGADINVQVVE
jgi:DNA-binding MarR family transcriptional regulator